MGKHFLYLRCKCFGRALTKILVSVENECKVTIKTIAANLILYFSVEKKFKTKLCYKTVYMTFFFGPKYDANGNF